MKFPEDCLRRPGRTTIAGAPEGVDALALAELARAAPERDILHIARDEHRLTRLADALAFFAPEIEVVAFPAWDCLPYDRVSPNADCVSRRIEALTRLAAPRAARPRIVLTTVSAATQRVPPRSSVADAALRADVGEELPPERLVAFLERNGYRRAETVREAGEYAVRGGILDIFPPGTEVPLRLDFFGDVLESVRGFDPLTQLSAERREGIVLKPVSEVPLDRDSIRRFRTAFRELFGSASETDPLYAAISEGRRHMGMEHWLPLFHGRLETLFDYLPEAAATLDPQADEAASARFDMIAEHYEARRADAGRGEGDYNPVPVERLYLGRDEWRERLAERPVGEFFPFAAPADLGASVDAGGRAGRDFAEARNAPDVNLLDAVAAVIADERRAGRRVVVASYSPGARERLQGMLSEHGIADTFRADRWREIAEGARDGVALIVLELERGFVWRDIVVLTEQDILGDRLIRRPRRRRQTENFIPEVSSLARGDLVVHAEHGIGRYDGLETLSVEGAPHDCLRVLYAQDDRLYVPVENIDVLSRYGNAESEVQLDRLGGAAWQARKARVKDRVKEIAGELIKIAAERQLRSAPVLSPAPGLYDEFCARFPYPETEDQIRAIEDTLGDLATGRPMDRLICGDVGFGKTEVGLRAAFAAVMAGYQVAMIVPTTLLCRQHFRTFSERFADLPVRVEQLSRLVGGRQAADVRRGLADGTVDIVIGTHALLAKDISFANLGLVIVDEEQRFGVEQKERLKRLRTDVHVLTLTATPIPRTLQLALSGVREMSLIATPPVDRLAVRTFVLPFDPVVIREAILRERFRGGQCFYVCPRIEDLPKVAKRLRELVPEVKVVTAHGRMAAVELEDAMSAFCDGRYDILLCTNIIESGLDIPSANTLIVHRADMFGLAQLYQLRGRVGRAKVRAYAYLTLPAEAALTDAAEKRLQVMQTLDRLGAGFSLASHDMDIRGAGNLVGEEQSGHIREVGIELYQHMLEEAVAEMKDATGAETDTDWTPQISLGMSVLIPESYVADLGLRLGLYRRIATLVDREEIESFAAEMIDRFGPLPAEVENLLQIVAIKRLCRAARVEKVEAGPKGAVVAFRNDTVADPAALIRFVQEQAGTVKLRPDHRLVFRRHWERPEDRVRGVRRILQELAELSGTEDAEARSSATA